MAIKKDEGAANRFWFDHPVERFSSFQMSVPDVRYLLMRRFFEFVI